MLPRIATRLLPIVAALIMGRAQSAEVELRGLWLDAFHAGLRNATETRQVVADARAGGFNAIFVQVRKRGDAYYRGGLEPVATDVAAGFDPLGDLIRLAHDTSGGQPRIQVHAWLVTFNIWNRESTQPTQPTHPYRLHPDWLTRNRAGSTWDGSNHAFDPAVPAVREHTHRVAMDILTRYDVDGIHWDYVRYAGRAWGYHPEAVARFNRLNNRTGQPTEDDAAWLQFRRDQVTSLVRRFYLDAARTKPRVIVSAATIAWAPGISTTSGWTSSAAYGSVLQDWRGWMEEGILDLNVPMAYFRHDERASDWAAWNQFAKDHRYRRGVAIGVGAYLNTLSNVLVQARITRRTTVRSPAANGVVFYSRAVPASDATTARFLEALTLPGAPETNTVPLFATPAAAWEPAWKKAPDTLHLLGQATDANGNAIDGALVEIRRFGDWNTRRTTRTDANGWFGAVDLPPGEWHVRIGALPGTGPQVAILSSGGGGVALPRLMSESGDDDGDGSTNADELLAGTDPNGFDSTLRLAPSHTPAGLHLQAVPSIPNRRYRLESASDLNPTSWSPVPGESPTGAFEVSTADSAAFYRLIVLPE